MSRINILKVALLAGVLSVPFHCLGESSFVGAAEVADPSNPAIPVAVSPPSSTATAPPLTDRWLDLKTLSYSSRYRNTTNLHGRRLFQFGQERYVAEGRLKLDEKGRYSINFHASSGRYFNWSYADLIGGQYKDSVVAARAYKTPAEAAALKRATALDPNGAVYAAGIPSRGGYFYPRQFYFSATPVPQVGFEFGSLAIEHGQNTEITSFDDDGYISGERLRLQDPKHLYFDRVVVTRAYLGSPLTPNFFSRGGDLSHSNYTQYLVEKQVGRYVTASTDYTLANSTHTMREAVAVKLPQQKVIDAARLELYQRFNDIVLEGTNFAAGSGFAVSAHNTSLRRRLGFEAGYAQIDNQYAVYGGSIYLATVGFAWNGDNYETGKRAFGRTELKLGRGVSAFGFFTHAVTPITIGHNEQGWTSGINIDLKAIANSGPKIF